MMEPAREQSAEREHVIGGEGPGRKVGPVHTPGLIDLAAGAHVNLLYSRVGLFTVFCVYSFFAGAL